VAKRLRAFRGKLLLRWGLLVKEVLRRDEAGARFSALWIPVPNTEIRGTRIWQWQNVINKVTEAYLTLHKTNSIDTIQYHITMHNINELDRLNMLYLARGVHIPMLPMMITYVPGINSQTPMQKSNARCVPKALMRTYLLSTTKSQHQVKSALLLNVVIR
jgi:hypothetical protein